MLSEQTEFNKLKAVSKRFVAKTLQNQMNCFQNLKIIALASKLESKTKKVVLEMFIMSFKIQTNICYKKL